MSGLTIGFGDAVAAALSASAAVQAILHSTDDPLAWPPWMLAHPRVFDTSADPQFAAPYILIGRTTAGTPEGRASGAAFGERTERGDKTLHCWMPGGEQRPALELWEAVRAALTVAEVSAPDESGIVLLRCRSRLVTTLPDPSGTAHQAVVEVTGIVRAGA